MNRLAISATGTTSGNYKGTVQGSKLEFYSNDATNGNINFRFLGKDTSNLTVEGSNGKFPILNTSSITAEGSVSLTVNDDGTLKIVGEETTYELPMASETILGGIKVGENLSIDSEGVLSAAGIEELPENALVNDKLEQLVDGSKASIKFKSLDDNGILHYPISLEEPSSKDFLNLGFDFENNLILTRDNGVSAPTPEVTLVSDRNIYNYLPVATDLEVGLVKPDGTSIVISEDGTLTSVAEAIVVNYETLNNLPQINGVVLLGDTSSDDLGLASSDDLGTKQDKLSVGDNLSLVNNNLTLKDTVLLSNRQGQIVEGNNANILFQTGRDASGDTVKLPLAFADTGDTYYFGLLNEDLALTKDNGVANPEIDSLIITDKNVLNYIPTATTLKNGVVKPDGTTIIIDPDGTIHGFDGSAKQDKLYAGTGIQISDDNVISSSLNITPATVDSLGVVSPDGTTITITEGGIISANFETVQTLITAMQNKINELETRLASLEENIDGGNA